MSRLARSTKIGTGLEGSFLRKNVRHGIQRADRHRRASGCCRPRPPRRRTFPPAAAAAGAAFAARVASSSARIFRACSSGVEQRLEIRGATLCRLRRASRSRRAQRSDPASRLAASGPICSSVGRGQRRAHMGCARRLAVGRRRGLRAARDFEVPERERAELWVRHEGLAAHGLDDRHPVRETIKRVAAQDGVLVDPRIQLVGKSVEPSRSDAEHVAKARPGRRVRSAAAPRWASNRRSRLCAERLRATCLESPASRFHADGGAIWPKTR